MLTAESWIADRTRVFDSSGIRRMFEMASKLKDPINLSIGEPDFDVPPPVKTALIRAIEDGKNRYALTQGIPPLREKLQTYVDERFGHPDREIFVCSGTSGGLVLSIMSMVNPGDEVIVFDPYFVMYESLVKLMGGVPKSISLYPDFKIDLDKVADAITEKTKMILVNSPSNPTGVCFSKKEMSGLAKLAEERGVCLVSDEIYSQFTYDGSSISPAEFNPSTVVIDGFSKSFAMTGLRLAYVHGPSELIQTMIKLQQYTFVCAPQPVQWAGIVAMDTDISHYVEEYKQKRDMMVDGLRDYYDFEIPGGAFYLFPKLPWGTGQEFVEKAIEHNLLLIPGNVFSHQDSHFRISFAVSNEKLEQGIRVLQTLAKL